MPDVKELEDPRDVFTKLTPVYDIQSAAKPEGVTEPGYYGLPILKRPFWKYEIALYFYFEGVSAGAYVLSTIAGLRNRDRYDAAIRTGRYVSFATMLLCPPLLIADLGRPERFHHMLRIWKKTSPMNHGAWALSGYGIFASILALLALPVDVLPDWVPYNQLLGAALAFVQRIAPEQLLSLAGMPFALTMLSYPGVLLETTANPVWSRSNFLGPLFVSSSLSSGAAALTLLNYTSKDHGLHKSLSRFEDASQVAEAAALGLYLGTAKKAARPLVKGQQSKLFLFGAIGLGLIAPLVLRRSRSKLVRDAVAPALTLVGAAALKWAVTYAGQESALDYEMASKNAPSKDEKPFWGPSERVAQPTPPL